METDVENECTGEILYATSYGLNIGRTLYHTSLNKVTDAWIESVKVQKKVVCENTAWADFELTTDIVLEQNDKPEIVAMRRFCYKSFCQNISSFFGITSIYQFLNKIFKRNYVLNSTDIMYKMFIDSMLYDVRFIVCVRLPRIAINLNKEYLDETENQTIGNSNNRSFILSPDDILKNLANDNLTSKLKSNNKLYVDNESIYSASDDGILSRYENEMNNISRPNKLVKNTSDRNIKNSNVDVGDSYSDIFDNYNDFSESDEGSLNNEFVKGNVDYGGNVINKLSIIPNNDRSARNDLNNIQADTGPTSLSATTATTTNVTTTTTTNNNNSNTTTKTTDFASTATTATVSENFNNGVVSKTSVVTTDVAKYENEKIEKEKTKSYYSLSFLNDEDDRENNVVITEQVEEENQSGQVGPSVNALPPSSRINENVVISRKIVEESENIENGDNFQYDDGEQITYEIDGPWLNKRRKKSSKIQIDEIENNVEIQENLLNDYDDDSNVEIEELKVEEPAPSSSSLTQQSQPQQQQGQFNNSNVEIEQIVQDGGVEQLTAADGGDGSDDIYSKAEELLKESVSKGSDGSGRMDIDKELKLDQFLIKSQNRKRRIREGEFEENIDEENLPKSAKYRLVAAKEKPKRLKNQFVKRRLIKSNNSGNRNMHDDDKENVNIIFARPVEEEMQLAKPLEDYNNDIREDEDNIIISEDIMESKQIHPTTPNMSTPPPLSLIKSRKRRNVREQNEEEYEPFLPPAKIRKVDDDYVRRQSQHEPPPPTLLSDNIVVDSYNEEEEYYANLASGGVNVQRQSLSSTNRTRIETFSTPTSKMNFEIQNTTSGSKKSKQKNIIKLPELLFVGLDDKRRIVESEQIMTNLYEEKMSYVLFKGIIINKSMDDTDLRTLARNNIVLFYTINRKLDGSAVMKLFKIVNNTINDDNYFLELHENIIDDIIHKLFGQRSDKSNFDIRRFTVDKANLNITMDNVLHLLFKRLDVSTPRRGSIRV